MADDKLIFPIGFDLEKGVKEALKDGDQHLRKMEAEFAKRSLKFKISFDTRKFDNLEAVKKRLEQLKIEPITPETRSAIKELARELQQLAKALEQVQKYSSRAGGTTEAVRNSQIALNEQKAAAAHELARQRAARAAIAEEKLTQVRLKSVSGINAQNKAYATQSSYVNNLLRKMVALWSIYSVQSFLTGVRDVTAEFELQRVSLGAIIQDQQRANQLFSEIKSFALQSPLKILDLTKYTKQVAAYGIETEKLFDTTKRLADVSVGLGVDMGRLVLAYGQVKAASYLRAAEIRQFTEAGIPMLELLAKKFTDLQGKMVSTEQVMDLVSKRAVSFSMVEGIFNDMTSAGGMFYNMQEKQAQTLFGMWSKLGDAAAMMYDEIGNTGWVNDGMKTTIGLLESMMRNWRLVGGEIIVVGAAMSIIAAKSKAQATTTALQASALSKVRSAGAAYNAILAEEARLLKTGTAAQLQSVAARKANAKAALDAAIAEKTAAAATNIWTRSIQKLKAALAGNWITLLITAVAALGVAIYDAARNATKLDRELQKIGTEGAANADAMARNFERLAKVVVESADGSKKQHEALEELKRTYSDIIPAQNLTIDKLRAMKGAYEDVAKAIREKVYQQNLERQISTIQEKYSEKISEGGQKTKELLASYGLDANEIGRVMGAINKAIDDGLITAKDHVKDRVEIISKIIQDQTGKNLRFTYTSRGRERATTDFFDLSNAIAEIIKPTEEMNAKIKEQEEFMEGLTGNLGKYTSEWERVKKEIADNKIIAGPEDSQFLVSKQNDNNAIRSWATSLKNVLGGAWDEAFVLIEESVGEKGDKMSYILFDKLMAPEVFEKLSIQQQDYIKQIQDEYNNLIPQDRTVASMRNALERIALQTGVSMDEMKRHLMNSGESWKDYSKRIRDSIKEYESEIDKMVKNNAAVAKGGGGPLKIYSDEEIKNAKDAAEVLKLLLQYLAAGKSGGRASDPRLQNLKEEISLTKKLYDEYQKLEKQIGATKAAEKIQQIYSNTIKTLQDRAKKYGFEFELPFTDENLKANMQHFIDKMRELQGLKDKKGKPLFPNIGKEIDEAVAQLEDVDFNSLQKALEKKLKDLSDRISRTKTAREFYEKILSTTGDYSLASKVAESIFGQNGSELRKALADQVRGMTGGIELPGGIISADNVIDYKALRQFAEANKNELGKMYDELIKISNDGQRDLAKTYEGYLKDLEKAKSYSDKRIELARYTANQIAEINASTLPKEEKERLTAGYREREDKEAAKLEWETFKDMPMYVQMFADLDHTSTSTLENMKRRLTEMQGAWKNLDPTQLKEMQSRLAEIDEQLAQRNPFKTLASSIKEYKELREQHGSEDALNNEISVATDAYIQAKADLAAQLKSNPDDKDAVENLQKRVDLSEEELKQLQKIADAYAKVKKAIGLSLGEVFKLVGSLGDIAGGIGKLTEVFGGSEEDVQYWNDIAAGLNEVTSGIENMVQAAISGNPIGIVTSAITAIPNMISGFANLFSAGKVRRANKEIKRQQKLLDQLDYTYGRLEKAADKVFGSDYISNYNQRLQNLQAQQAAYEKQAQAERSKGKKEDKEKTEEYLKNARDTADEIAEMQSELRDHFLGTDIASAARDFASAWIDAKTSFADTTDAMRAKFKDMVQNMIIEAMAAKIMENALQPFYKAIDKAAADGDITADEIAEATKIGLGSIEDMNKGMEIVWAQLKQAGLDVGKIWSDAESGYTGIAKNVASATSEEINANTAALNTQNYYMSHVPQIAEHVAAMRQLMERATTTVLPEASAAGWTDWQRQAMDNYNAIARNTAETVAECRRSAAACEAIAEKIGRVVVNKGGKFGVNSFLNS